MKLKIGVLGIQGDFAMHQKSLRKLGVNAPNIRYNEELALCDGLVIPGGESTTFVKLLKKTGMFDALIEFNENKPIMGTCAGLIALSTSLINHNMETLGLIDISVERNGYGRQVDSFIDDVRVDGIETLVEGFFIRAPRIRSLGEGTKAIGFHNDEVVMAGNERILAMTFHPELTNDTTVHRFFIDKYVRK
ncbi:pyridoxal 5'-phosphate synthase glutaminase subunit PdxT [bacterium]|nr:pyridoxal 5'-phosphate synthase glutaminase subunit PdxT [bacterium]